MIINSVKKILSNKSNPNPKYAFIGDICVSMIALTGITYIMIEKTNK